MLLENVNNIGLSNSLKNNDEKMLLPSLKKYSYCFVSVVDS